MTSGNHIWDKKEAIDYIGAEPRLLRPANYPAGVPGSGSYLSRTRDGASVGVINVMGRVFMIDIDDPFAVVLREIEALRARARVIFVDFHAEATSEKIAMGWHLDGKVTEIGRASCRERVEDPVVSGAVESSRTVRLAVRCVVSGGVAG